MLGELKIGFKPKLGLSILAVNMHMHSRFFSREEIETKATFAKNSRTHERNDTRTGGAWKRRLTIEFTRARRPQAATRRVERRAKRQLHPCPEMCVARALL